MSRRSLTQPAIVVALLIMTVVLLLLPSGRQILGQEPTVTLTQEEPIATPTLAPHAEPLAFLGSVTINGEPAADGRPIEALVGPTVCGTTTTSDGRYTISVNAGFGMGADFQEGCGGSGPSTNTVMFRSGNLIANEQGHFIGGTAQMLDLTFGQAPRLPDTGSGAPGSGADFTPGLLWVLLGVAMAALVAALAGRRMVR